MKKETLWTKDFILITITTALSAIGGEALVLPVSLLVFDKTQSTFLSSIIFICGVLPDAFFSVLVAPLIDNGSKKKWVIGLDAITVVVLVAMGVLVSKTGFVYSGYVVFTLLVSIISVFYRISFFSWFPSLITPGFEQKGYAVSNTLYPVITLVMAPVAAFLYQIVPIHLLFLFTAALTVLSIILESFITDVKTSSKTIESFKDYCQELKGGFQFFKKEKGIRNIYSYVSLTNGVSTGLDIIKQAYFQTSPHLSVMMFGLLTTFEMIGRSVGGFLQYFIKVKPKKRFGFTKFVYTVYDVIDAVFLFMPYPLMSVTRLVLGGLGVSSATIRETAVQSYLPSEMRGRVNAISSMLLSIAMILFQLIAGILGEIIPLRIAALIVSALGMIALVFFIFIPTAENRKVYEATVSQNKGSNAE